MDVYRQLVRSNNHVLSIKSQDVKVGGFPGSEQMESGLRDG